MSEFNNLISMLNDKNDIILSQQAKIDCMQVRIDGANERALSILNHKNVMADKMQAEIDEVQNKLDYHVETNADLARLLLELQGQIDEALTLIYKEKSKVEYDVYKGLDADLIIGVGYELHLILKGNKDEN